MILFHQIVDILVPARFGSLRGVCRIALAKELYPSVATRWEDSPAISGALELFSGSTGSPLNLHDDRELDPNSTLELRCEHRPYLPANWA